MIDEQINAIRSFNRAVVERIGASNDPFDVWFRGQVKEIHKLDFTNPPAGRHRSSVSSISSST